MRQDPRVERFVDEYLVDFNGTQAALRAGYSRSGARVQACRLLTRDNVKAMIQERQEATAKRLQVTREDIVRGLLVSIEMAREQGDAGTMIRGAAELSKLLGFYPEQCKGKAGSLSSGAVRPLEELSDDELLALVGSSKS